ncbi:MAG: hypothetical protein IJH42_06585, partial [Atopobiaceae bacterium]|nr:hypothetical protein [Atopobiaceae bacterium]
MSKLTRRTFLRAFGAAGAMSLAACSGGNAEPAADEGGEQTEEAGANAIAVCLASEPDTIDPALNAAVDGATMISHFFAGLAKWNMEGDAFVIQP